MIISVFGIGKILKKLIFEFQRVHCLVQIITVRGDACDHLYKIITSKDALQIIKSRNVMLTKKNVEYIKNTWRRRNGLKRRLQFFFN